jgi:ribosomal protein S21
VKKKKTNTKLSNKQKTDESFDEVYHNFKRQNEKEKIKLKIQAVKLKSSTPTHSVRGKKKAPIKSDENKLFLEISPIRRSASNTNVTHVDLSTKTKKSTKASDSSIDQSLHQESNVENSDICALKELIDELKMKRELSALDASETRNASDINLVLKEIENICKKDSPEKPKKSVHFNALIAREENAKPCKLKPGKWRKSLIAWRKSINPTTRKSSRKFSGLFPIKTDPNLIKRFTEKLHETLSNNCEYICELFHSIKSIQQYQHIVSMP